MKKIILKTESCIGCGACVAVDSEHFEFSDEGFSFVKSQENLESPALSDAIDACPVAIISLEENNESNEVSSISENDQECDHCECEDCHCNDADPICHCHGENNKCSCNEDIESEKKAA